MNRRTRIGRQHRGWTPQQRTPEALARDIPASILQSAAVGITKDATSYTRNVETLALVAKLLNS
jgi:hypothetical protein